MGNFTIYSFISFVTSPFYLFFRANISSKFEAEQATADAELKQLETRRAMKPEFTPRRPLFRCWPQTQMDQLVIALSDEEDDE